MRKRRVGIWMYQNGGGDKIEKTIVQKLQERGIEVVTKLNLRYAFANNNHIKCNGINMDELDCFFSYNAGEQTQYQMFLYKALDRVIPCINNFGSLELTEDKFQTNYLLQNHNIPTADFRLCHRDDTHRLKSFIQEWKQMVYKPTDGWGGVGLTKIDNEATLDTLLPFLNQMDLRFFYVEKFIDYDKTDFRVDIVDGEFVGCYGRRAGGDDWRTNITSGGSVFLRDADGELIELAKKATKITGLEIAGVDIIYDREKKKYLVLEVNGIPAFATPSQEELGLDFNAKKIDLIVDLIDKKSYEKVKQKG